MKKLQLNNKQNEILQFAFKNGIYCNKWDTFNIDNDCYCLDDIITDYIDSINNASLGNNFPYIEFNSFTDEVKNEIYDACYEYMYDNYHYPIASEGDDEISDNIFMYEYDAKNGIIEIYNDDYLINIINELKNQLDNEGKINDIDINFLNSIIDEINAL